LSRSDIESIIISVISEKLWKSGF